MSTALDSAALAAVTHQNLTIKERENYATEYFWSNFGEAKYPLNFEVVDASAERVELKADAKFPTTLSSASGREAIVLNELAVGELTRGEIICLMTLDRKSERSFEVTGGAKFSAKTCSVQVNSLHDRAAIIDHGGKAVAKDFCVSGGAVGTYEPHVNTECSAVSDPYENLRAPEPKPCVDQDKLEASLGSWQAESVGIKLYPGTYCHGLSLRAKRVEFTPGIYVIKNAPLFFDYGTRAEAKGVTFVFQGERAFLDVHEGSSINVEAPKDGLFAGLAFFQDIHTEARNFTALPVAETVIRSGGNVRIVGTAYLPTQKISFVGGSIFESQAPATSFIGYKISIGDGANIAVAVDHEMAGLPPILPRSDESARLSR